MIPIYVRFLAPIVLLIASCSTPSSAKTFGLPAVSTAPGAGLFARSTMSATLRSVEGRARILDWKACRPSGGYNACVRLPAGVQPRVGETYTCSFHAPSATAGSQYPHACWVLWSDHVLSPAIDYTQMGYAGCWLTVPLENASYLGPEGGVNGVFSREAGSGRVDFNWSFPPIAAGRSLYLQAAWLAPGQNAGGILVSQPVEIAIGTAR